MAWDTDRTRPLGSGIISVADEGEFGLINRITARLGTSADVLLGPGDDAAIVAAADGRVVASTDLMVEGRHFRRDWSSGYDVGRKAAAANLADVVAMGARPTALLVGLAAPAELDLGWVDGLTDGLRDECARVGAAVVGGDLVRSDTLTIAATALGDLEGRVPLTRSGARPGDIVVLLGHPGRAAAGLAQLQAGGLTGTFADAHRRPDPEYDAALTLARGGWVTAMIDVSDGLLADLGHVAAASQVSIDLVAASLPVDPELIAAAHDLGVDPLDWVAGGGDDHCFVATVRAGCAIEGRSIGSVVVLGTGAGADLSATVSFSDRATPAVGGHEHFRT
jgi:thiamine-monophosphate kinase